MPDRQRVEERSAALTQLLNNNPCLPTITAAWQRTCMVTPSRVLDPADVELPAFAWDLTTALSCPVAVLLKVCRPGCVDWSAFLWARHGRLCPQRRVPRGCDVGNRDRRV